MTTNTRNAKCLTGTNDSTKFQQFITDCRTTQDLTRANNFFNESKQKYKDLFDHMGAQFDDLIHAGDGLNTLTNLTGATTDATNQQLDQLQKRKDQLLSEINHYRTTGGAADKSFLEDVMHGRAPKSETAPTLQDMTLLLFWFGWAVLAVTLVAVRMLSPGGNWRSASFAAVVLLLVTLCVYAILKQVA